ncbi:MAG TPA: phosphate/phosphite/phosphonate ABC transporter substrate-binding protein [Caulobacteraceae bacterium]|jgi:phosphonate transport system substrate-binding protein|nr:phosphate/phosphite/phosphonate ABC transporter substrate-binding protein [Caulobacteraceae bacterium]
MFNRPLAALGLAALALSGCGRTDPHAGMRQVRMAVTGGQSDPTMAMRWTAFKTRISQAVGVPAKVYESSDYNGPIQAVASNQVDVAWLAGGGYANVDAQIGNLATPILTTRDAEGGLGYYSAVIVKSDSPYHSIRDLKGRSFGYVDFNSTSGYLFPRANMREQGIDPDTLFGKTGFSGGHTQSVMAMQNGQFDGALVEMSGGTPKTGFSAGPYYILARRGLIDPKDFRVIWLAGPIPNPAVVVRTDRPQSFIDTVRGAIAAMPFDDPKTFGQIGQTDGTTYAAVDRSFYENIIKLRADDIAHRRGLHQ